MPPTQDTTLMNPDHSWSDLKHSVKITIPKHLGNARSAILHIRALKGRL